MKTILTDLSVSFTLLVLAWIFFADTVRVWSVITPCRVNKNSMPLLSEREKGYIFRWSVEYFYS